MHACIRPHTRKCLSMLISPYTCIRMPPYADRAWSAYNLGLTYPCVCQLMIEIFHTLAYANTIRNSVTGPFGSPIFNWIETLAYDLGRQRDGNGCQYNKSLKIIEKLQYMNHEFTPCMSSLCLQRKITYFHV
jgi:hypothetical protein